MFDVVSRKKARAALALAVSLWIAEGVFWAPGVASAEQETEVTITSKADADDKVTAGTLGKKAASPLPYDSYFLNTGTKMNITGEDCKNANFFAGYSDSDEMSGYTLTVDKGTFDATTELAGGYSFNGKANNNNVYINGGEGGAYVYGGRGQVGASGNTVDMTGGTVGLVHGAYTHDGDATGNTVTISGGTVDRVFGGESHAGSATGNSVTVSGGTIGKGVFGDGVFGDGVYGGRVYGTINSAGDAEKNTVTVSGGTIDGSVYGGGAGSETESKAAATGNKVTISETDTAAPTTIKKEVYGGYSQYNAANKNILEISGGTVNSSVYGGMGGTEATGNTVTISGGAIGTDDTNNIYGGRGNTDASENKVTISGGKMSGQVYGGYSQYNAANKNVLEISSGTVDSSVTGGYVDSFDDAATAEGNTVTIEGGTVNGDVNGGVAGSATDNTVTISGGTIKNSVYGGMGSTEATGNTVTISGGTIDSTSIFGGNSKNGTANDNTVEITGGTFKNKPYIYGGSSNEGKATGNTVKISVANFEAGRICVGDGATSTGNTLVLDAKGIDVHSDVGGVQTIALTKNVKFEDNTTVLKAGKFAIDNNAATNFDGTLDLSAASFAGDGAMTLLEVTSGNEDDNLATMTVAYTDGKGQAQTGTLTVDTPVRIKAGKENDTYAQNNVTLTYDSDVQQVAMKDAGQKVVLESGINGSVKDVAMGTVQWQKGSTAMDAAGAGFTLDGKTTLTDNLDFDFAGAEKDVTVNDSMTLLVANQEMSALSDDFKNFSGTIGKEYSVDTAGVTIDAKVTATAAADGKSLTAAITANQARSLTFGAAPVAWSTTTPYRDLADYKFAFGDYSSIDTSGLTFTDMTAAANPTGQSMTLLANAAGAENILAANITQPTIVPTMAVNMAAQGVKLAATATGSVGVAKDAVKYTVDNVALTGVDLTDWDGTTGSVPTGWTANLADGSVTADRNKFAPKLAAGTSKDVLTASTAIFTKDQIAEALRYTEGEITPVAESGVTLTGRKYGGVQVGDSGKKLTYFPETMDVNEISFGAMTWDTAREASADGYVYTGAAIDASGLSFAHPETIPAGETALLKANATLADFAAQTKNFAYENYSPVTGVTLSGTVNGSVRRSGSNIVYTATENKAGSLTFTNVDWLNTGALIDHKTTLTNISFDGADVDTTKISFMNVSKLDDGAKMTLVSDFGTRAGTISGTDFTLGTLTGKGYAYCENNDLLYLVTEGVGGDTPTPTPTPEPDVSGQTKTVEPGETVTEDVAAAKAEGRETATSNTATVSEGGTVGTKEKPANVTGATTESGEAKENEANITGGTVYGNVAGALSTNGNVKENQVNITGGEVTGTVVGASTKTGALADGNSANVFGGTVTGSVAGAEAAKGAVSNNSASISEKSIVNGDVIGAGTESGTAMANSVTVTGGSKIKKNAPEGSEKSGGDVIGAMTGSGTASQNTVTVTESIAESDVSGALSTSGEVNTNSVTISGGDVGGSVYGGQTAGTKRAASNGVVLKEGAEVKGDVYGGMSEGGAADGNTVEISGEDTVVTGNVFGASGKTLSKGNSVAMNDGTVGGYVFGTVSKAATANNIVTMTGGTVKGLVGGGCETSTENYVSIEDGFVEQFAVGGLASKTATGNTVVMTGGGVKNGVYGGYGETGAANGNNVYLGGGTVYGGSPLDSVTVDGFTLKDGGVYGGYSVSGTTTGNSVYLYGDADVSNANIYGGNGADVTGNVLVIGLKDSDVKDSQAWTGGEKNGTSVANLNNFDTIRFDVVKGGTKEAALKISDGTSSNLSTTKVDATNVHFKNVGDLSTGATVALLDDKQLAESNRVKNENVKVGTFTADSTMQGTGSFALDENGNIAFKVESVTSSDQSHNAVMGMSAGMAALTAGNDFIGSATEGLSLTSNTGADGVSSFAKLGGGSMRQETGSHVDTHTWNAILALGHANKKERGTMEYGAFFEYGTGNYSTFNDADQRGDGSMNYTGGGLLAKWTAKHGFYVEGSLRAGTVHDDARNVLRDYDGLPFSYETNANYFGAHLGVGKEIALLNGNSVDVYGKYFFNRRNGISFNAGGGHYDLDAVTSQILRVGARYTVKRNQWDFYVGAAYEHELDGKATGTAGGLAIQSADPSGGSFRGEIGATMRPGEKSPWQLDLNVAGFAGKKQGVTGGVSVSFMF